MVGSCVGASDESSAENPSPIPLVGFVDWQQVAHHGQLAANHGEDVPRYYSLGAPSWGGAGSGGGAGGGGAGGGSAGGGGGAFSLDARHTHFVMVDSEGAPSSAAAATTLEAECNAAFCRMYHVPGVVILLQGAPSCLPTILRAVRASKTPVMLLSDSGGAAGALALCLEARSAAGLAGGRSPSAASAVDVALRGYEEGRWLDHSKALSAICDADQGNSPSLLLVQPLVPEAEGGGGTAFDVGVLHAILQRKRSMSLASLPVSSRGRPMSARGGVGPPARLDASLRLAVQWDRADVLQDVLGQMLARADGEAEGGRGEGGRGRGGHSAAQAVSDEMGRALLYALATQREESSRVLIEHRASLNAVNLCFLYASGPPSLVPSPEPPGCAACRAPYARSPPRHTWRCMRST